MKSVAAPDDELRVLVLADFSGRAARGVRAAVAGRRPTRVDIDHLDAVFSGFGAQLPLPPRAGAGGNLQFGSLDDFHPDALLAAIAPLHELLTARRGLDTADAAAAAATLQRLLQQPASPMSGDKTSATSENTDDTLSRLLGKSPGGAPAADAPTPAGGDFQAIIRHIVGTSSSQVPAAPAGTAGLAAAADLEITGRLRAILRDPALQRIEAAWRGLDFLIRRCPDEERMRFFALDVSFDELAADPAGLSRVLEVTPCHVIVCDHVCGAGADFAVLIQLARAAPTQILAGVSPSLGGCDGFDRHPDPDDWRVPPAADVRGALDELRAAPESARIALGLPRFLVRQPYGKAGDRIESFDFEELADDPAHESFLWGNAAFLLAQCLIERHAGAAEQTLDGEIVLSHFPVARHLDHGGTAIKPAAEAWLVDRAIARLAAEGFATVQSVRNENHVRVRLTAAGPGSA